MFRGELVVRGPRAELLNGYATAARLSAWMIAKHEGAWMLTARAESVHSFLLSGRLRFAAPRRGGFWYWPIAGRVETLIDGRLRARMGAPE